MRRRILSTVLAVLSAALIAGPATAEGAAETVLGEEQVPAYVCVKFYVGPIRDYCIYYDRPTGI